MWCTGWGKDPEKRRVESDMEALNVKQGRAKTTKRFFSQEVDMVILFLRETRKQLFEGQTGERQAGDVLVELRGQSFCDLEVSAIVERRESAGD